MPVNHRTNTADLEAVYVKGDRVGWAPRRAGPLAGDTVDQTIYHKNLQRLAYVFAETAGRPQRTWSSMCWQTAVDCPRRTGQSVSAGSGWVTQRPLPPPSSSVRSSPTAVISAWNVPPGFTVDFAGEGEWKITLDVFRDLGLAFGAAMIAIYVLLAAQTGSFAVPVVVMLAIPLTVLGVMPGFWLLNVFSAASGELPGTGLFHGDGHGRHDRPSGHRHAGFNHSGGFHPLVVTRGRTLFDAIMESRVVRLRPILLTATPPCWGPCRSSWIRFSPDWRGR